MARRTFGNIRKLPSGRFQASYIGNDGHRHNAPRTFYTKTDANRWLTMEEATLINGTWESPLVTHQRTMVCWPRVRGTTTPSGNASRRAQDGLQKTICFCAKHLHLC
jgi:hypothetical protein